MRQKVIVENVSSDTMIKCKPQQTKIAGVCWGLCICLLSSGAALFASEDNPGDSVKISEHFNMGKKDDDTHSYKFILTSLPFLLLII